MPRRGLPDDGVEQIVEVIRQDRRRIDTLEKPDGSQLARALEKVLQLIQDLPGMVSAAITSLGSLSVSGSLSAGTSVTAGGVVNGVGGITSLGAVSTNLASMSGTRTPLWMHDSTGTFGYAPSTAEEKTDIVDAPITLEQLALVMPRAYRYSAQVALEDTEPGYEAPVEIGLLAEDLDAAGLGQFVVRAEDGTPKTIDYATLGAVAAVVVARHLSGEPT